ncbi:hypothetical protein J7K44_03220 [bacterium]|nr:hypothetical protein [bacterium]
MPKQIYLLVGIGIIVIVIFAGIYWFYQKELAEFLEIKGLSQKEIKELEEKKKINELSQELESLTQDVSELERISEDKNLEVLEEDMSAVAGEVPLEQELSQTPTMDLSDIESTEKELSDELEGISNDLTDLKGFEGDTSLNELEDLLSGFAK